MQYYKIKHTDKRLPETSVEEKAKNFNSFDITLLGRKKQDYGQDMNANFLHILENFACPENSSGLPDISKVSVISNSTKKLLSTPTDGQLWFNTTRNTLYLYNERWIAQGRTSDAVMASGTIAHGETIPIPQSVHYSFSRSECVWLVSPTEISQQFEKLECFTDTVGKVTMRYIPFGSSTYVNGCANYFVIGIKNNTGRI